MRKRTRSILEELSSLHRVDRKDEFIQTTGTNIIESAINLLTNIHKNYDPATALDLERRFLNSIKTANKKKFFTGVEKIIESKKNDAK